MAEAAGKLQPQISDMFQKFALAFRSKTFELFSDEPTAAAEDVAIPDNKVTIHRPDPGPPRPSLSPLDPQLASGLISSIFAGVSSFEASYLQLQDAHVPFKEGAVRAADEALVAHLKKLSEYKRYYRELRMNPGSGVEFLIGSCLEAQVEDNQSKLRLLGFFSDRLQAEIDQKDSEVLVLRRKLGEVTESNSRLSKKVFVFSKERSGENGNSVGDWFGQGPPSSCEVLLSVKVFGKALNDACSSMHRFTKVLIGLMRKAGWDLDLAASSVCGGVDYANDRHCRYAFLSYVCLGMFRDFDCKGFGLDEGELDDVRCNGSSLRQLVEHVWSSSPMELLSKDPGCAFSRFCESKYQQLVHPTMESSIFRDLDQNEVVLNSWRSLRSFYESFVSMANSVWTLHMLAFCFDPVVEIFQVERGTDFSAVYLEDVTRNLVLPAQTRLKVGFTVVPGFKIGRTVIQSKVYLTSSKCTEVWNADK